MVVRVVELTIVTLSSNVNDDSNGQHFPAIVTNALCSCTTAQQVLKQQKQQQKKSNNRWCLSMNRRRRRDQDDDSDDVQANNNVLLRERLMTDVMKYVRVQDKYTALTSLLLKSQAFFKTFPHLIQQEEKLSSPLPIVDLPRTSKGKPFVPTTGAALEETEANCYPLSVSHQYPFCGVARLVVVTTDPAWSRSESFKMGLDIVVFEPLRTDLYATVEEYLQVFRSSFCDSEWTRMHVAAASQSSDEEDLLLKEFYLRWSMKEAYTKALGLGMYLDFCKFETRLDLVDNNDDHDNVCGKGKSTSLWSTVMEENEGIHIRGRVRMDNNEEEWDFFFLPLCDSGTKCAPAIGCACVCFGPLADNRTSSSEQFQLRTSWTALDDLIDWHKEG